MVGAQGGGMPLCWGCSDPRWHSRSRLPEWKASCGVPQTPAGQPCPPAVPSPGRVTFSAVPLNSVCPPVSTGKWSPVLLFRPLRGVTTAAHPCIPGPWHRTWYPVQFSSAAQSCPTLCNPMNRSKPGFPVHHQLLEFTQTHVYRVGDAIQPSHPLSSPFSS